MPRIRISSIETGEHLRLRFEDNGIGIDPSEFDKIFDMFHRVSSDTDYSGIGAGLAINPATPLRDAEPFLDQVDLLLIMTVVPGFGGQKFMEKETMPKVVDACEIREARELSFHVQVDGGIASVTAATAALNGANVFVAGTSVFKADDMATVLTAMRES